MSDQISHSLIPPEWQERFYIRRFEGKDILISKEQRNKIIKAINKGDRFVQVGKYTLMLRAIKSIDPYYEPKNIPPKPKPKHKHKKVKEDGIERYLKIETEESKEKRKLWERLYSGEKDIKKLLKENASSKD